MSVGSVIFILFVAGTALAENSAPTKRYMITMKSPENYRHAREIGRSSPAFLATNARAETYLDNVEVAIVNADETTATQLRQNPLVATVEAEHFYPAPYLKVHRIPMRASFIPPVNSQLTWGIKAIHAPEAWKITKGQGVRVMVLDGGVDVTHPDLKNRFEKAMNFVFEEPGLVDTDGHGTHVSGTILADGTGSGLLGVAPAAKLLFGKVCGPVECSSVSNVRGIEWAIREKVDVVNYSVGGTFTSEAEKKSYARAESAGIVFAAASGNSAPELSGIIDHPAVLDTLLAVGALNPDLSKADFSQWGPELDLVAPGVSVYSTVGIGMGQYGELQININGTQKTYPCAPFYDSNPTAPVKGEIANAGLGKSTDVLKLDLKGKIALLQRGDILFDEKVRNVVAAGAIGVLIANNEPGLFNGDLEAPTPIPVMMIEQTTSDAILQTLMVKKTVLTELNIVPVDFDSWDGTSMSTPHVAGVAALVKSMNKNLSAAEVRNILKSTATPLLPNTNNEFGSGLVNADKAVSAVKPPTAL